MADGRRLCFVFPTFHHGMLSNKVRPYTFPSRITFSYGTRAVKMQLHFVELAIFHFLCVTVGLHVTRPTDYDTIQYDRRV